MMIANKIKAIAPLNDGHQVERSKSQMLSFKESPNDLEKFSMQDVRGSNLELFNQTYANTRDLFTEPTTVQ